MRTSGEGIEGTCLKSGGTDMKRNVSLLEISDGRLYSYNDMVKANCRGCRGCSSCCRGMGNSIILDPYDIYRLQAGLGQGLTGLMEEGKVELNVVDGCILPNLKMTGEQEACAFLDEWGRCSVYEYRPGICRLFPLGRYYEDGSFKFFLQTGECAARNRSKVKVGRWIDTPELYKNHDFICRWHDLLEKAGESSAACGKDETVKLLNMALLQIFYMMEYDVNQDFYIQFENRCDQFEAVLEQLGL